MTILDYIKGRRILLSGYGLGIIILTLYLEALPIFRRSQGDIVYLDLLLISLLLFVTVIDYCLFKRKYQPLVTAVQKESPLLLEDIPLEEPDLRMIYEVLELQKGVDEQKRVELERALMDMEEYLTQWVHEIKLPLATLQMMLEREEDYELQLAMRQEWEQINVLVNGVLFGSRTTCLREDLVIREENLKKMIQQSIKHNAFFLIKYRFEVQLEFESVTVWTDRKWLVYVLDQLLLNAIKYRSKTPMLTFSVVTEPGVVHLTVHDNGCGIKEQEIPRIFNKGFTGSNGRKETYKSTGMGLYFSKRILDRLGHPIVVQSEVSKSTDMTISFYQLSDYANLTKVSH